MRAPEGEDMPFKFDMVENELAVERVQKGVVWLGQSVTDGVHRNRAIQVSLAQEHCF